MLMKHRNAKRGAWIDILLIGSIIALMTLIIITVSVTGQFNFQKPAASATTNKPSDNSSMLNEKDSEVPEIKILTESSNDNLIPYAIVYPKTPFSQVNEQIQTYIEDAKQNYITQLNDKNQASKIKTAGDLIITTEIYDFKDQYYSIVLKKQQSLNRVSYRESFKTFVFHKKTGEIIQSHALFNNNIIHLNLMAECLRSELIKYYGDQVLYEKLAEATSPSWDRFDRFALNNDSIMFYFNQGELADEKAGSATINMPISYLNPILASAFQNNEKSEKTIVTTKENRKKVALTFDDGPHPQVTPQILNTLEKYGAKATFFMVGEQVKKNKDIAQEVLNRGHEIGNHTYNHPLLTKQSTSQVAWQVDHTSQIIHDVTGVYPTVFRPPYGASNQQINDLVDMPVVLWTIDTYDWKYQNPNKLLPMIQAKLCDGAIILMHDIHQSTADGLDSVLAYLQKQGYECVTVSELLAYQNGQLNEKTPS